MRLTYVIMEHDPSVGYRYSIESLLHLGSSLYGFTALLSYEELNHTDYSGYIISGPILEEEFLSWALDQKFNHLGL